ncbi:MAG TPA: Sec-independent protein translocase protein TatB [Candidatus Hydrogenedens sp.]|nr:Sec-independent protein translocase protein TatB [Candidatus Hydrogenedens sp.]HOK09212.1 Sec-independent protein translocase protein TatB [Candidatus Hydrogenedens sp.]HOL19763.1 Sec-independent protein translocase protein TatB [Candidatus Hydrogenedens sp.]HPP59035.1 Sec-independent protein translocase protein TatB [Candidatus Hydrogenedens sp.]
MIGIGFTEMIIIAGIALVVLGPEKFPEFAKIAIRTFRDLRGYLDEIKTEIAKEVKPLEKEIQEISRKGNEVYREILEETNETSYTTKGYNPSTSYLEHSVKTDEDIKEEEETTENITSEETDSYDSEELEKQSSEVSNEIIEPYDPDIPQADLQKMAESTPHNDEDLHENNEDITEAPTDIKFPERLDG